MIIIGFNWFAWVSMDYHWLSLIIIGYHWLSMIIIDYHWLIDYLKIWKRWITDWLTDNLKSRDASASKEELGSNILHDSTLFCCITIGYNSLLMRNVKIVVRFVAKHWNTRYEPKNGLKCAASWLRILSCIMYKLLQSIPGINCNTLSRNPPRQPALQRASPSKEIAIENSLHSARIATENWDDSTRFDFCVLDINSMSLDERLWFVKMAEKWFPRTSQAGPCPATLESRQLGWTARWRAASTSNSNNIQPTEKMVR